MNFRASVDVNAASFVTSMMTGIWPVPPGAGKGHPFELRAGAFFGGELQVVTLRGRERVNDVYRYEVVFVTDQPPELVTSSIFGMPAALTIKSPGNDPRVIQGIAASIEALGGVAGEEGSKRRRFRLTIVPKLWLLRRRRRNAIFQNKSIPQIVMAVLAGIGIQDADCRWRADPASYPALPFVYQRGETDYDFFRRVLASAGIFFFYEHASGFLDSMFGPAAGAVGAAAGMIGGPVGSLVSSVESATAMVPVLNFGAKAGHTAAVANAPLPGLATAAVELDPTVIAGRAAGNLGAFVAGFVPTIEEPSDTLAFDDDMGADAQVERVYEFELKKTLRTKEIRLLDRNVEASASWVGVADVPPATASAGVSAGVSLGAGLSGGALSVGVSVGLSVGGSLDVDAPQIPNAMLRQEIYQADCAVWQDAGGPNAPPPVSLSAAEIVAGITNKPAPPFDGNGAIADRLQMELERVRRKYQDGHGRSDCRRVGAGYRVTLGGHPIRMVNGEYTITALDVEGVHPDFLADGQAVYRNRFRCIPSNVAPRPKRPKRRPKPGMEVATVVNFLGADKLSGLEANPAGYVRVRFRWDVLDDEYATPNGPLQMGAEDVYSVWLPVVQPWAGAGYGAQFIPREGMEVLVGFMEDQTERPVILGCLYSNANPPPWPGYVDHQKVGIVSQTRPADGGYSEISVDDRQGAEVVHIRAQKDMTADILNDRGTNVGHDRRTTIGHDDSLSVGNDRTIQVTADHSRTVGGNDTLAVTGNSTTNITGDESVSVTGNASRLVTGTTQQTLVGDVTSTMSGRVTHSTQGQTRRSFASDYTERHLGHRTVIVGQGGGRRTAAMHVEGNGRAYASKTFEVEALEGLTIVCGSSQLLLSPTGITLSSPNISLVGQQVGATVSSFTVTASGALTLGGQTATVQTAGAELALDATSAALKGTKVQLGAGSGSSSQQSSQPATITRVQMKDAQGKPRANARVLLVKGGPKGEQRMTVLDKDGMLELIGNETYTITFPDDAQGAPT